MSKELIDDCLNCETCYGHCRYREKYWLYHCDVCGKPLYEEQVISEYGKDYCEECYEKEFEDEQSEG